MVIVRDIGCKLALVVKSVTVNDPERIIAIILRYSIEFGRFGATKSVKVSVFLPVFLGVPSIQTSWRSEQWN